MRKRIPWILIAAAAIVLVIILGIRFTLNREARLYFSEPGNVQVSQVERSTGSVLLDVTIDFDLSALTQLLGKLDLRPTLGYRGPYLLSDETWEIHGMTNNKSFHIMLGKDNILYSSADDVIKYRILNPEILADWLKTHAL
jgi:hypothetical protein